MFWCQKLSGKCHITMFSLLMVPIDDDHSTFTEKSTHSSSLLNARTKEFNSNDYGRCDCMLLMGWHWPSLAFAARQWLPCTSIHTHGTLRFLMQDSRFVYEPTSCVSNKPILGVVAARALLRVWHGLSWSWTVSYAACRISVAQAVC